MANEDPRYGDASGSLPLVGAALPRPWGRYVLLHALAQGGMGAIFVAKYAGGAGFERYCVIKTLRRQFTEDQDAMARFLDEARVVAQLQHTNICSVFDVGQVDGRYYLAMDYIAGFDAHAVQRRCQQLGSQLPPGVLFHIIGEVLDALDYAHRLLNPRTGTPLGIVHRDVSPTNIMISFEGEVKLIDFGMALSTLKHQRTEPALLVGKVAYMSPEQATGDPVDARADQFAAALVLYELLTGEDFYAGVENKQAIWTRAALGDHRPPSYAGVDPALRAILDRALSRDRTARFATCADFRSALDAYAWAGGWRASKAELRKLMAERFSLEMSTQQRLMFTFGDVHVAPTLDVVGVAADASVKVSPAHLQAPVPVIVGEASDRVPKPTAPAGAVPAAVSLDLGKAAAPRPAPVSQPLVPAAPLLPPAPVFPAPAPPFEPMPFEPMPFDPVAPGHGAGLGASPLDMPSPRPALVAAGARPSHAAGVEAADLTLAPPGEPALPATTTATAEGPAAPGEAAPLVEVPPTDVVRVRQPAGTGRARRRAALLLSLTAVAVAAVVSRSELRGYLVVRGLWPGLPAALSGADAGPSSTSSAVDAGAAPPVGTGLVMLALPVDAGAATAADAGPAPASEADAGMAGALPPPPRDAPLGAKRQWLEQRCPKLACVADTAKLLKRKGLTRPQRLAVERAVDRCVARCAAHQP